MGQLYWSQSKMNDIALTSAWKPYERFLFRIAFVFFILFSLPFREEWWTDLWEINWLSLHYRDLYSIARFQPSFDFIKFGPDGARGGLLDYAPWGNILVISLIVALIWTFLDKHRKNYEVLYYWLRVVVRYRAAIGIIGFGFTKLLPTQMPYPSWGLLNTDFGDFTTQKIYWLSVSIVPWYQVFGGVVELLAGVLLLFRRTVFLGAALLFGALGTIVYVNYAYDGGVHVYAAYFVLLAAFLMIKDIPAIYNLLIREKNTVLIEYYPNFSKVPLKYVRYSLRFATVFIFLIVFGYVMTINFIYDPYKQPSTKGVTELRGNYEVVEFRQNSLPVAYTPQDSIRWRNVSFEKWSTLAFNVNKPLLLDLSNGGGSPMRDINRTFEIAGVGGGKKVFYYEADTVNQILYLQSKVEDYEDRKAKRKRLAEAKNSTRAIIDWVPDSSRKHMIPEYERIAPIARTARRKKGIALELRQEGNRERMILHYTTHNKGEEVLLKGIDGANDTLQILLRRINKPYLLSRSTLEAGQYD